MNSGRNGPGSDEEVSGTVEQIQRKWQLVSQMTQEMLDALTPVERTRRRRLHMLEANGRLKDRYRLSCIHDRILYRTWKRVLVIHPEWSFETSRNFEFRRFQRGQGYVDLPH